MSNHEQSVTQDAGLGNLSSALVDDMGAERRRWKPPANHPWRQYRSVYLQKKRLDFVRERQVAECA